VDFNVDGCWQTHSIQLFVVGEKNVKFVLSDIFYAGTNAC